MARNGYSCGLCATWHGDHLYRETLESEDLDAVALGHQELAACHLDGVGKLELARSDAGTSNSAHDVARGCEDPDPVHALVLSTLI